MTNRESNENTANYFYPDDVDSTQEKAGKVSEGELSKLFFTALGLIDTNSNKSIVIHDDI